MSRWHLIYFVNAVIVRLIVEDSPFSATDNLSVPNDTIFVLVMVVRSYHLVKGIRSLRQEILTQKYENG